MPLPKVGVVDAYKEIIPAIFRQSRDKNYFVDIKVPKMN